MYNLSPDIKSKYINETKFSNLLKTETGELTDFNQFYRSMKLNPYKKTKGDMVALKFEQKRAWEIITTAIIDEKSDESKLFDHEILNYRDGQRTDKMFGY